MPSPNKPTPKTPSEILNKNISPKDPLSGGNANISSNRGNDISVKDNTEQKINIRLIDIYEALVYYINNVIQPVVVENNQQVSVPIQYAFGERWNAVQKEGFLRDKDGRVLLPMIVIKRDSVAKNRTLGNKLDGNNVQLYQSFQTKYTRKNQYDNFAILTNRIPVKQYHIAPVPDYVVVTYNASILTNSVQQLDDIIQAFNFAENSYWGQSDRFRFNVAIDSFTDTVEYSQGEDRSVRSNFNIVVNAYLLPESVNRSLASQQKRLSKASIRFTMETSNMNINGLNVTKRSTKNNIPVSMIDTINHTTNNIYQIPQDLIDYLSTDVELTAVFVDGNTAEFNADFLVAPGGLPATSISNFIFFANGQYLNTGSLLNFIDNGDNTSTLTINTGSLNAGGLGYSFQSDWQITARGKFGHSSVISSNSFVDANGNTWVDSDGSKFLIQ